MHYEFKDLQLGFLTAERTKFGCVCVFRYSGNQVFGYRCNYCNKCDTYSSNLEKKAIRGDVKKKNATLQEYFNNFMK